MRQNFQTTVIGYLAQVFFSIVCGTQLCQVKFRENPHCNQIGNLQKPLPGDVSLFLKDSFFCAKKNAAGETTVCCPLEGVEPTVPEKPAIDDLGKGLFMTSCK